MTDTPSSAPAAGAMPSDFLFASQTRYLDARTFVLPANQTAAKLPELQMVKFAAKYGRDVYYMPGESDYQVVSNREFWLLLLAEKIGGFESIRARGISLRGEDRDRTVAFLGEALWCVFLYAETSGIDLRSLLWHGEQLPGVRLGVVLADVLYHHRCGTDGISQPLKSLSFALQTSIAQRDITPHAALSQVVS